MKILIFLFMFFVIGGLIILENQNLFLYNSDNMQKFSTSYVSWLDQVYLNIQTIYSTVSSADWFFRKV